MSASLQVAPWLRVGSLRGYASAMALHALTPALSRHWSCPGCSHRLLGTHAQVQEHLAGCAKALVLPREVVESCGYEGIAGSSTGAGGGKGGPDDVSKAAAGGDGVGTAGGEQERAGAGGAAGEVAVEVAGSAVEAGTVGASVEGALPDAQRQFTDRLTWAGLRAQILELTAKAGALRWGRRVPVAGGRAREGAAGAAGAGAGLARRELGGLVGLEGDAQLVGGEVQHGPHEQHGQGSGGQHDMDVLQVLEGALGPADGAGGLMSAGPAAAAGGPATQSFACPVCGLQAQLTAVEILQHKRSHR
jgi:hypothetical protein